jgi:hypothetical protein
MKYWFVQVAMEMEIVILLKERALLLVVILVVGALLESLLGYMKKS